MEEDWLDAYWILFDCLSAVENAITQRFVDLRRRNSVASPRSDLDTDGMVEQLRQTRTNLIISIFHIPGPMTPPPELLESLALTLLDWSEDIDQLLTQQESVVVSLTAFITCSRLTA